MFTSIYVCKVNEESNFLFECIPSLFYRHVCQREEEERKEEERRRTTEERRRLEKERLLKERRDAEERDRKMNEKLQMIEEQRWELFAVIVPSSGCIL